MTQNLNIRFSGYPKKESRIGSMHVCGKITRAHEKGPNIFCGRVCEFGPEGATGKIQTAHIEQFGEKGTHRDFNHKNQGDRAPSFWEH